MSQRNNFNGGVVKPGYDIFTEGNPLYTYNLYKWGQNNGGQLGLGNTTYYSSPKQIGSLTDWAMIADGNGFSGGIKTNGTLWMWGSGGNGRLGLGNTTAVYSPVQVGSLTSWSKVSLGGAHALALKTDGTVWAWGSNAQGQLGLGNSTYYSSPKQVGSRLYSDIAAGNRASYALDTVAGESKSVYAWGQAFAGTQGNNTTTPNVSTPAAITSGFVRISGGRYNFAGIKTNGTMWYWGFNNEGQGGLGNITYAFSTPQQIGALTTWLSVSAGYNHTSAIDTSNRLWTWGGNSNGTLGHGNTTGYSSPKQVGSLATWTSVKSGPYINWALKSDGSLWSFGRNVNHGALGLGNTTNVSSPVQVGSQKNWRVLTNTAGVNQHAGVLVNTTPVVYDKTQYSGIWTVEQVNAAVSAGTWPIAPPTPTHTLYGWGYNASGELGLDNTTYGFSTPQQVGPTSAWRSLAGGGGSAAFIRTNGTLFTFGGGGSGRLGHGNTTAYSSPKQVGSLGNWATVKMGGSFSLAVKADGTLWSWGGNPYGNLGLGNTTYYSSPKQIGALTNWSTNISCVGNSGYAITTAGALYAWGYNPDGILGLGDTTNRSTPTQVGALTNWYRIVNSAAIVLALKTDGTLWSWGNNYDGRLGLGNTTNYSSPKQVGSLTTWAFIGPSSAASFAIKTDGTLWSWGGNAAGDLGLGGTTAYSSPKQIGALTTWSIIGARSASCSAIKTDGTLWSWGNGFAGALGLGNTTSRSSPVQVGALTTWSAITNNGGGNFSHATATI